jgi:hypothetical protein
LLGLLREGSTGVARLLAAHGLDVETAYREADTHLPRGKGGADWEKLPLTPAVKRVMASAREAAAALGHPCVAPEHLFCGLFQERDGEAALVLAPFGLNAQGLREELRRGPAPDNRDWMLRPEPTSGVAALADPSVQDLEAVLTREVLPTPAGVRRPPPGGTLADGRFTQHPTSSIELQRSLLVLDGQLHTLQMVSGAGFGAIAGFAAFGLVGACYGFVVGFVIARVRNVFAGVVVGMITGAVCGVATHPENHLYAFAYSLAGLLVGWCMGDWRKMRPPRRR